jgi:putative component of membrane protein insertase Oxa1/YidC/SpoIIIJ protein YidD
VEMMQDNYPSQSEQDEAWAYCCKRKIIRSNMNISKACCFTVAFMCIILLFSGSINTLFDIADKTNKLISFITCFVLGILICMKKIIIGVVELYQHYAPEHIRRKCLLKPTCSEYMILAIEKYGVIRGVYKGMYRLLVKCRGTIYSVDYP